MKEKNSTYSPIGVFDSGYGGLTILKAFQKSLPQYDYLYLGDNARAPYGNRSFDLVYEFTLEAVKYLFDQGCQLVIIACNTASAKALRTIQQHDLPAIDPNRRVLGVIRPTAEMLGGITKNGNIGIFGTRGTIDSGSYTMEVSKLYPDFHTFGQPCPMWVPLIENKEADSPGADYFVKKYIDNLLEQCHDIDTVILGCTHYPLLLPKIKKYVPSNITLVNQGQVVADSLKDYLRRHPEMEMRFSKGCTTEYLTTECASIFSELATVFLDKPVEANHIVL